ncbi:MAG: hypothetical protein K2I19_07390, partial [Muribaculaceae bacterium]|nr:hypothetical protein [Muribaculaceae bacterium]
NYSVKNYYLWKAMVDGRAMGLWSKNAVAWRTTAGRRRNSIGKTKYGSMVSFKNRNNGLRQR